MPYFDADDYEMDELVTGDDWDGDDWDGDDWDGDVSVDRMADALRLTLIDDYTDASDGEIAVALDSIMESMSPAEAFNFGSALNQIGRSAGQVLADPRFAAVARTTLPVAGSALGTVIGGPVGTALGGQLGTLAAQALPGRAPARPAVPPGPGGTFSMPVPTTLPTIQGPPGGQVAASPTPPVFGGSTAAAQGLILTQQPQVLQSLLAAALGQHGQRQVGGVPVAQLLGMLSNIFGEAAADADELDYVGSTDDDGETVGTLSTSSGQQLYTSLIDADNLHYTEAADRYWISS